MKIFALKSNNEEFKGLIEDLKAFAEVDLEQTADSIFLKLSECDAILLDLDEQQKITDKLTKKVRKNHPDLPIFVLANNMDAKKLGKHQQSKLAPDLYFRYPTEPEVLEIMLSEYRDNDDGLLEEELADEDYSLLEGHQKTNEDSTNIKQVNNKIDSAFEDAFSDDFMEMEMEANQVEVEEGSVEADLEQEPFEISADEFDLGEEFNLGEDDLNDKDSDDGFALDDEVMSLDESEVMELGAEEEDSLDEELLPSSEDLEFPDVEEITKSIQLEMDGEGEVKEFAYDKPGDDNSDSLDELVLGDDESENSFVEEAGLELGSDDDFELSLGDDEPIVDNSADDQLEVHEEDEGLSFDDGSDLDDLEFSLGEESDEAPVSEESDSELNLDEGTGTAISLSEEEVDESFDPFAEDDSLSLSEEDDIVAENLEANEPEEDLSAVEFSTGKGGFEVEEGTLDEGELENLFADKESKSDLEIEHEQKNTEELEEFTLSEDPLEEDSFMDIDDPTKVGEELTASALFVDESTNISAKKLPESPPDFTQTIKARIDEIDALVDDEDEEFEEEATMVAQMPTPAELQQEQDEATQVFSGEILKATADQDEDKTKTHVNEDLIEAIESEDGADQEVHVQSRASQMYVSDDTKVQYQEYVKDRDEELMRLGETIKSLRADREGLLDRITELEESHGREKRDFLNIQAELDEKKIEVEILKKRYSKEIEDIKFRLDLATDKKDVLSAKNKQYENEFEKLRREKKVDVNRVRARERELEEKLELLKRDTEVQIRNRDHKILELKRRIDTLEFDIENAHLRERKKSNDNDMLEDRMDKVIKT
ncbi:MAG: hypothetical protein VYA54_00460, partial [Bdellovibrionota bacterium]|nr:hypothetical protein [Bdellovibrionota bacterium]